MSDYQQKISGSFNERVKLNRLRRKKEHLRFWDEFRIIPKGLIWTVVVLYLVAQIVAYSINHWNFIHYGNIVPPELHDEPGLAYWAIAGMVTAVSLVMSVFIFLVGYVNRDAKRRGMNSTLWTLLVVVLLPAWTFIGFLIYFLMREPLPYACPQCATTVGARFNFCPNCKCNLHPSCPNCKREVVETDKYCPYCAYELGTTPPGGADVPAAANNQASDKF